MFKRKKGLSISSSALYTNKYAEVEEVPLAKQRESAPAKLAPCMAAINLSASVPLAVLKLFCILFNTVWFNKMFPCTL